MLTTRDETVDQKLRLWRQHSMSVPDTVRHSARDVVFEEYGELGYNYRMTDIQAAVGRAQLSRLPELLARRRMQAAVRTPDDIPGLCRPSSFKGSTTGRALLSACPMEWASCR
jgi:dTDP-4-amino-4,6-dideoxygalactose transaminase